MRGENRISARITWTSASGIISDKPHSSHKDDDPLRRSEVIKNQIQFRQISVFIIISCSVVTSQYALKSHDTVSNIEIETRNETVSEEDKTNDG